jgi:hypothetical protein
MALPQASLSTDSTHPALRLFEVFNGLHRDNLHRLAEAYAPDVRFTDPAHEIHGLAALERYFVALYAGVESCQFELGRCLLGETESALFWTMTLRHRALERGRPVRIEGATYLKHNERVLEHRDYFDLGALLYERVPLIGGAIRALKRRLGAF